MIRDASALGGFDCFDAEAGLLRGAPSRSSALVIGPAGEARTVVASVMHEGAHALGRGGLGAVFGSKGIKGILVSSPGPRKLPSSPSFSSTRLEVSGLAAEAPAAKNYQRFGTPMMVAIMNEAGAFPSDFFSAGRSPHRASLEAEGWEEWAEVLHDACAPCPMRCRKRLRLRGGESAGKVVHGPEYETLYAFGGSCGVAEAKDVAFLNERCNRLGLDTMSAGNLVGLAIKARERAELGDGARHLYDGAPRKGEVGAIEVLLEAMAKRSTELGDILGRGMDAAAAVLGVEDLAITSKGLEPAGYEPRKMRGMALSYALSPRGACHLRTTFYKAELAGLVKDLDDQAFVATLVDWEDRLFFADSLVVCRFFRDFLTWERVSVCVSELAGRTVEVPELRDFSRDILTRIRRLNEAMGLGPEDDDLAPRFFLEGTDTAPPLDRREFESRRRIYWESRGWGSGGRCPAPAS